MKHIWFNLGVYMFCTISILGATVYAVLDQTVTTNDLKMLLIIMGIGACFITWGKYIVECKLNEKGTKK